MKLLKSLALGLGAVLACSGMASAETDVIPVGTIKYNPAKAWNSYVILAGSNTAKLIDRNGNLVKEWNQFGGEGMPNKVYPGGHLLTTLYPSLSSGAQDNNTVALLDFDGNIVRQYNGWLKVDKGERGQPANPDGTYSVSRQHHDFQLEGSPTGYYAPGVKPKLDGKMLVLAHDNVSNPKINSEVLLDDVIYIVDKKGEVIWTWYANEHFDQFGFSGPAKNAIRANTKRGGEHSGVDWLHINCASWLGPNKWYDKGDKRFHPDNIISRQHHLRQPQLLAPVHHRPQDRRHRVAGGASLRGHGRRPRPHHRRARHAHDSQGAARRRQHPDFRQRRPASRRLVQGHSGPRLEPRHRI